MLLDPTEPSYWIISICISLLAMIIALLLFYMVIRLAITHGMLSYSRQLEASRHLPVHRD